MVEYLFIWRASELVIVVVELYLTEEVGLCSWSMNSEMLNENDARIIYPHKDSVGLIVQFSLGMNISIDIFTCELRQN